MHPALEIQEILLNIFGHCYPPGLQPHDRRGPILQLAALARVCRTFKEPALDVLWEELDDFSPLASCIPTAFHRTSRWVRILQVLPALHSSSPCSKSCYSLNRGLTQTEWDIFQSYARRIRSINDFNRGLAWESACLFLNPPALGPVFPSLRHLRCMVSDTIPLLHLPLPSLTSLDVHYTTVKDDHVLRSSLDSFSKLSSLGKLSIAAQPSASTFPKILSRYIGCWNNLQIMHCPQIPLDMDALVTLSRSPLLASLNLALSTALPDQIDHSDSLLFFPCLNHLTLRSKSLHCISKLLSRSRLPVITDIITIIDAYPSKDVAFFFAGIRISNTGRTIQGIKLSGSSPDEGPVRDSRPLLTVDDLRPWMVFSNLRRININIGWSVSLTDAILLELVVAWPHLGHLRLNEDFGWNMQGGVTPDGLARLLQTCRSLNRISVAIDTRGYIGSPSAGMLASLGSDARPPLVVDVLDSVVEEESVAALVAFFTDIMLCIDVSLRAWRGRGIMGRRNWVAYNDRWMDVLFRAKSAKEAAIQQSS